MNWKRKGDMFTYKDDEITAFLTSREGWVTEKDRNVPPQHEVADPEMLADGIPSLIRQFEKNKAQWEEWDRQGWWPKPVKKEMYHLMVMFEDGSRTHGFGGEIDTDNTRVAMKKAEEAIEKIRNRRYPRWMEKVSNMSLESRVASVYLFGKG